MRKPDTQRVLRWWFTHLVEEQRLMTKKVRGYGLAADVHYLTVDQESLAQRNAAAAAMGAWRRDLGARLCLACSEPLTAEPDLWLSLIHI